MNNQKKTQLMTSCTECQRRKQKCSREWPCNHCQSRKVPHLCQFGQRRVHTESLIEQTTVGSDSQGQKRSLPDSSEVSSLSWDSAQDAPDNGLKAWGYMPWHVHYNLRHADADDPTQSDQPPETNQIDVVGKVLHVFPSRSITDAFVNHFLIVVNYRYNSVYAPTFTEQYVQWWSDRSSGKKLSPEFTCLLLRVCAHSSQYLSTPLRKMVEFELACSSQAITEKFDVAADQLSKTFDAHKICLERVQELFLKAAWLKSESRMIEAWHMLGRAIHEAQELGINTDSGLDGMTDFEKEIRRRVWTLLYIWDWQMSAWLCRPHLIDQKDCSFTFPSLRLEGSAVEPNLLSPFAHIALQAQLARRIARHKGDVQSVDKLSADQVIAIEAECERFIDELPPIFRFELPDLSLDVRHPYYVAQRRQLHVVMYMTMLDFLKPYLTRAPKGPKSSHDAEFRNMGIEVGLKLLNKSRLLFEHEFPINVRFHLVVFCLFDSATVLCSAIIHDTENILPRREQVMDAVESALDMLHQLRLTKIGAASHNFLFKLIQSAPVLSRWILNGKRPRITAASPTSEVYRPKASQHPYITPDSALTYAWTDPVSDLTASDNLALDMELFLAENPVGDSPQLDIGGLEEIWDWQTLNLDAFIDQDAGDRSI